MAEITNEREERREEIKLVLEYWKLAISIATGFAVIGGIVFAALQWNLAISQRKLGDEITESTAYNRIASEWKEHLKIFIEKPHLRAYFEEKKQLSANDDDRAIVFAIADIRLNAMDTIISYVRLRWGEDTELVEWTATFKRAFEYSPALCSRVKEARSSWDDDLIEISDESCPKDSPQSN